MTFAFRSSTARAAWAAATTQLAQLEALRDEWSGQVSVRYYSAADEHLATVTHETPSIDVGTTPYALVLGAWAAESHIQDGTAAYAVLAVPSGDDILRADVLLAGPGGAITDPGGRTRLDIGSKLRVQATSTLPTGLTALETFAATLSAGDVGDYTSSLPSLNTTAASGSRPWDTTALSLAELGTGDYLLDWASMMEHDPATKRWYISGGRPDYQPQPLKMVIFDEIANEIRAVDQWSGGNCGHLYRSTAVLPGPRKVLYFPNKGPTPALFDIDAEALSGTMAYPPTNIGGFTNGWIGYQCIIWHPTLGSQGSIVFPNISRGRVLKFDWASQTWAALGNYDGMWSNQHMAGHYHPLTNAVICGSSELAVQRQLVIVDSSGGLSLTAAAPCTVASNTKSQFFPHPTRNASINFCHATQHFWTYEWDTDEWIDQGALPSALQSDYLIAAPTSWGALIFKYGASGTSKAYAWKPNF